VVAFDANAAKPVGLEDFGERLLVLLR
jgi:hypothetical protein